MPIEKPAILAFNRGRLSALGLARVDIARTKWSSQVQTNWMPRVLGSMQLRPGLGHVLSSYTNAAAIYIPFIFASDDTALLEFTSTNMRVIVDDAVVTRSSVSTSITNGTFDSNVTSWTDADESGATSAWATGGYMSLVGSGFDAAIRYQEVTVAGGDQGTEHGLRIVIERGPVKFRVGSTAGDDDYFEQRTLGTGSYSIAITPTGNFFVQFSNVRKAASLVDSVSIESSGALVLPAAWTSSDLTLMRWSQSADVVYVGCEGFQQRKIERHTPAGRSWGIVLYEPESGPFRTQNIEPITLAADALNGDVTLTASQAIFKAGHVGGLFSIDSVGQEVVATLTAEDQFTDPIRVTGVENSRIFQVTITGTWVASVTLQRSVDEPGAWVDVTTYTTNQAAVDFDDGLDNQVIYYRIGIKSGDYTSGTAVSTLTYSGGSRTGIVRITAVASDTSASAAVLSDLGGTDASSDWAEGLWSDYRGWPTAVELYEGRLWWPGKTFNVGSESDGFEGFDQSIEGDSAPIVRSIGAGPVDVVNFIIGRQRLLLGTLGTEYSVRSSSLDEPLSRTAYNPKIASEEGSAKIDAVGIDSRAFYIQRGGVRVNMLEFDASRSEFGDYASIDLTALVPEIGEPSLTRMAVQRKPDKRIHFVRSDGTIAVLIFDRAEDVLCWVDVETDGSVEDVVVLPGTTEDAVYYLVNRTIESSTVRYLEKWALESECQGGTLNKQADSHVIFTNSPAASSIPAGTASHLVGESVVVWADGKCLADANGDIATFTVEANGGISALTNGGAAYTATTGILGLGYTAQYQSTKLAYAAGLGTPLGAAKRVSRVGLIMANIHAQGIKFGPDFNTLDPLPKLLQGAAVDADTIHTSYDYDDLPHPGGWGNDERLCLQAQAPRPATVLAAHFALKTNDRV